MLLLVSMPSKVFNLVAVLITQKSMAIRSWVKSFGTKNAAFIAALYGLNLVLSLAFKGAYHFRAWDVFMLWFIVDAMLLSSWVELLRKRVGDLAGKDEA